MKNSLFCVLIFVAFFLASCGNSDNSATSSSNDNMGQFTDSRDGQTYKTVTIGTQTWMAQNLNYEMENSFCGDDGCAKFGRYYKWEAAMDACPSGWHLPTMDEFETLFAAVGDPSTVGLKLKSTSSWNDYNGNSGNGTDDYSFSALPVGYRGSSEYGEGYNRVYFWSSTEHNSCYAYSMDLNYYSDLAYLGNDFKYNGFSVRCVKD